MIDIFVLLLVLGSGIAGKYSSKRFGAFCLFLLCVGFDTVVFEPSFGEARVTELPHHVE